jgi:hypothetical protein
LATAREHAVAKAPGQGEFDGVLLAPALRAPDELSARLRAWRTSAIAPLPLTDHDGLHMHWRWGAAAGAGTAFCGWSPEFEPHSVPGAPMVPPDQRVELTRDGPALRYRAHTVGPRVPAGRRQVVLHHGLAFGLEIARGPGSAAAQGLAALADACPVLPAGVEVPLAAPWFLHWNLRYCSTARFGPHERLQVLDLSRSRVG